MFKIEVAEYVIKQALLCLQGKPFLTTHLRDAEDVYNVLRALSINAELTEGLNDYIVRIKS